MARTSVQVGRFRSFAEKEWQKSACAFASTEEHCVPGSGIQDIDLASFRGCWRRKGLDLDAVPELSIETDLFNREVLDRDFDGTLRATLYGPLCFGKDPQGFPPTRNLWVDLVAYAGTDRGDDVLWVRPRHDVETRCDAARTAWRRRTIGRSSRRDAEAQREKGHCSMVPVRFSSACLLLCAFASLREISFSCFVCATWHHLTHIIRRSHPVLLSGQARGRLDEQVARAEGWLKSLGTWERYKGLYREDRWILPLPAFRECVVNAVAHRDYAILGSRILVEVFDDRVVVMSPGALPNHKRRESVLAGGTPRSRNEAMANVLFDLGLMEQRGSGFPRMRRLMRAFNGTAPLLEDDRDERWVRVTLWRIPQHDEQ